MPSTNPLYPSERHVLAYLTALAEKHDIPIWHAATEAAVSGYIVLHLRRGGAVLAGALHAAGERRAVHRAVRGCGHGERAGRQGKRAHAA